MIDDIIRYLKNGKFSSSLVYEHEIPSKEAQLVSYDDTLESALLKTALKSSGIEKLYTHQAEAYKSIKKGLDTLITTPTASGKTLCYNIPIIEDMLENPDVKALYLFPIKALGYDQKATFESFAEQIPLQNHLSIKIIDGDTNKKDRRSILKDPPAVLVSNPDIIHYSMLPRLQEWKNFLKNLKYVVIDEIHTYRGIFGTQIYNLFLRFARLAPDVQFICASATIGNPKSLAQNLTGRKFFHINKSGAASGKKKVLLFNPEIPESALAQYLLKVNLDAGVKTICFTKSRKLTEKIYSKITAKDISLKNVVSSYRAGFLPEERRKIEKYFHEDKLKAVIATSAIEMGIDVGGVDATILVGYPGSLMSLWQRAGRAGRGNRDSLISLIASNDALDQYYMKNPDEIFRKTFEEVTIDKENTDINKKHILCAAYEKPVECNEEYYTHFKNDINALVSENKLFTDKTETKFLTMHHYPHKDVDFRMAGETYSLICNNIIIGTNSGRRLYTEHFENAVYLHRGDQFIVRKIDHAKKEILLEPFRGNYYTTAKINKETVVLKELKHSENRNISACFSNLQVSEHLTGYDKISTKTGERLQTVELDREPIHFETKGFYIVIPEAFKNALEKENLDFMGSIHAVEHALIAMIPYFILCDRMDIAGISYPMHPQLSASAIFIYDSYAGGAGICNRVFDILPNILIKTLNLISSCKCEEGCPACIYSPKCGSGNYPLDKEGAIKLIDKLLKTSLHSEKAAPNINTSTANTSEDVIVFDLETKYSADEVGGWKNAKDMGISVLVSYSLLNNKYMVYKEKDIPGFITDLLNSKAVIGFNIINFDLKVLSGYVMNGYNSLNDKLKHIVKIDLLQQIKAVTGRRFSLDNIAGATLNTQKSADGLQALRWFKNGEVDKIIEYCKTDVKVTKDIFLFGIEKNEIYANTNDIIVKIPVNWKHYKKLFSSKDNDSRKITMGK